MSWAEDYRKASRVRELVIERVVPVLHRKEVNDVMKGVELGLLATDKKKRMQVTREGTEVIELYLRYLENFIYEQSNGKAKLPELTMEYDSPLVITEDCEDCGGFGFKNEWEKRKRVSKKCHKCEGTGTITKEQS
jgi:excinuclease UvrABC ATPase subunit